MTAQPLGWDAFQLKDDKKAGLSPEMAKALLAMNPALREQGFCEKKLVAASQAPQTVQPVAAKSTESLLEVVAGETTRLAEAQRAADDAIAKLKAEKDAAKAAALAAVYAWLCKRDPDLLSPLTQRVLQQQKEKLAAIGFTIDGYMAARKKR